MENRTYAGDNSAVIIESVENRRKAWKTMNSEEKLNSNLFKHVLGMKAMLCEAKKQGLGAGAPRKIEISPELALETENIKLSWDSIKSLNLKITRNFEIRSYFDSDLPENSLTLALPGK